MEILNNKTVDELFNLLSIKKEEYKKIEDECVKNRMDWSDAIVKIRPIAIDIFAIEQELRLHEEPAMLPYTEDYGSVYKIEDFIRMVNNGAVSDEHGYGRYAMTKKTVTNIQIFVADIVNNKYRNDLGFVVWKRMG